MTDTGIPEDMMREALDRFERAAMAYERLGRLTKDDEKPRAIRNGLAAAIRARYGRKG